jgi:hypothetical protein
VHRSYALELANEAIAVRGHLAKMFLRVYASSSLSSSSTGGTGTSSRYFTRGTAEPQCHAMFVKALCLHKLRRTAEAVPLMEQVRAARSLGTPVGVSITFPLPLFSTPVRHFLSFFTAPLMVLS